LVSLSEGGGYSPPPPMPVPMAAFASKREAMDTSVSPGELKVRVEVSGLYELVR
jgi:uncharacterized protein YggE